MVAVGDQTCQSPWASQSVYMRVHGLRAAATQVLVASKDSIVSGGGRTHHAGDAEAGDAGNGVDHPEVKERQEFAHSEQHEHIGARSAQERRA